MSAGASHGIVPLAYSSPGDLLYYTLFPCICADLVAPTIFVVAICGPAFPRLATSIRRRLASCAPESIRNFAQGVNRGLAAPTVKT